MNQFKKNPVATAVAASLVGVLAAGTVQAVEYEVWAADQSNSVASTGAGQDGSLLWIWDSESNPGAGIVGVREYLAGPANGTQPTVLPCRSGTVPGPCDIKAIFPGTLLEFSSTVGGAAMAATGGILSDTGNIARLHGAIPDPQNQYVNINLFSSDGPTAGPNGNGFVGIISGDTKEPVALFRVSQTNAPSGDGRSLHMSFWNATGTQLLLANLHGRILERIDLTRDATTGVITEATFNQAASVGMGGQSAILDGAKVYKTGAAAIGQVSGAYSAGATSLTYTDGAGDTHCKQNTCGAGADFEAVERGGNVIVCPIVSSNNLVYVTFGGGGLLVVNSDTVGEMEIVGAYGNSVINGAGCGGVEIGGNVYLNAGTSAAPGGKDQSTFTLYQLATDGFSTAITENSPAPVVVPVGALGAFNTDSGGATGSVLPGGTFAGLPQTGQLPGTTFRSDAHGMSPTVSGRYLHVDDRIQNVMGVTNTSTLATTSYSLAGGGCGNTTNSWTTDDAGLIQDDAAPDLMATGPNNKFLFTANRGPVPVTVSHNAQGSCPGVGVVTLTGNGGSGSMTHVIETHSTVSSGTVSAPVGGHLYTGAERSDPHGVAVRIKTVN